MQRRIIVAVLILSVALGGALVFIFGVLQKVRSGEKRCSEIGAEYKWGRDFSVCVKPDGSMHVLPTHP